MIRSRYTLATFAILAVTGSLAADEIDFARDIRPILSDNCYHCHGPDEKTREADLRLDTREGLFRWQDDAAIVVPHDIEASELIRRVTSHDADRMPPVDSQRRLTETQIDFLQRWVQSGAPWDGHWSFQPIVAPKVPAGENAIDYFVRKRLEHEALKPSAEASRNGCFAAYPLI